MKYLSGLLSQLSVPGLLVDMADYLSDSPMRSLNEDSSLSELESDAEAPVQPSRVLGRVLTGRRRPSRVRRLPANFRDAEASLEMKPGVDPTSKL